MPITFGSVGDIISVSLLIKDLVKSLDNSRGSSAEYQAMIRELWSLDHALIEVEMLFRSCEQMVQLNALRATVKECAEQCRMCITMFQGQIKKYEKSLQPDGSDSFIRDTALKLRWQVSKKEDLAKFRAEINAHCFSINMLLTTTGVTLTKLNDANLHTSLKHSELSRTKSSATQASELAEIKSRIEENNALVKAAASETRKMSLKFDVNYFKNLGADILSFMQKIWRVNLLTYKAVISLQTSIPAQLERCWTQEPATLEDALGRVSPVHLEFLDSWEAFEAVLEVRFRRLPGHRKIKQREYALRINALKRDVEQSLAFNRCFLPGQRIDMSMIFDGSFGGLRSCPGCDLATSRTEEEIDLQVQCPGCKLWYQRVVETVTTGPKPTSTIEPKVGVQDTQLPTPPSRKRQWIDDEDLDDIPAYFRRVRLRYWDEIHKLGSSLAHTQGVSIENTAKPDEPSQRDWDHLDLYKLKKAVARYGGFETVCELNRWAEVGRDVGYRGEITSSLSMSLKNSYQRWLHPYEQYLKIAESGVSTTTSTDNTTVEGGLAQLMNIEFSISDIDNPLTRRASIQNRKRRRDSQPSRSDSFNMPKFHPANLNPLSHPIGTSYMPNAQLMYSSDEESDDMEAELPDLNARISPYSQPAGRSANDTSAFAFSVVNSNPPIHPLGSNGLFNEWSHAFATPSQLGYGQ